MKMHRSNNIVLKTLSGVNYYELLAACSKYSIDVSDISENIIKQTIWNMLPDTEGIKEQLQGIRKRVASLLDDNVGAIESIASPCEVCAKPAKLQL